MTQREQLKEAAMMALKVKGIAKRIRMDSDDYDERWALAYADELERTANGFLKNANKILR